MPLAQAQTMVPGLAVAEADPAGEAAALARVAAWCLRYAPMTAADPPDGIWIDASGCAHLFGGEQALLADLLAGFDRAGIAARVAIADTPGAAWAVARHAGMRETIVPVGGAAAALAALPVAGLRLPPEVVAVLRRLGLTEIGALTARAPLTRRFGRSVMLRLDQALGRVAEPIVPVVPPSVMRERLAFVEPIATAEAFVTVIGRLVATVCGRLERAGEGARRLDLLFERVDGTVQAIRIGTARPVRAAGHLGRLLEEQIETVDPGPGVEAMCLAVLLAEPLGYVQGGSDLIAGSPADVAVLVDRLINRLGSAHVFRAVPVESDIAERSVTMVPPLAPPGSRSWPAALPRPIRLLDPAVPVQTTSLLPDHPPAYFTWRHVRHRVRRADGPERVYGEWWRTADETSAVRDYFAVEDEAGERFWLYREGDGVDLQTGGMRWFLQGIF